MPNEEHRFDTVIVGGGLAGLCACAAMLRKGTRVALFDRPLPQSGGRLGGFARFSGAKFSLFPAGSGLAPLVGGVDQLTALYASLVDFMQIGDDAYDNAHRAVGDDLGLRSYHSIVLTPDEVESLLDRLAHAAAAATIRMVGVKSIKPLEREFEVVAENGERVRAARVIVAAGRAGSDLLLRAGCEEQPGKGCDVGVRLEFPDRQSVAGLRALGPDAKIILKHTRTFCLNSPGEVFHYQWEGVSLPGGVVAHEQEVKSNFGVLCRVPDKAATLSRVKAATLEQMKGGDSFSVKSSSLPLLRGPRYPQILGKEVVEKINAFAVSLSEKQLVDFDRGYTVHFPLLDWHWPVFSLPKTFETTIPGIYAVGDTSGHARGLLQAAAAGWACGELLS